MKQQAVSQVHVGEISTVVIEGLGSEGEGIGRLKGITVFIAGALPGEEVEFQVTEVKTRFARAKLLKIIKPAPERVRIDCPVYEACGSCQLLHLDYQAQLKAKTTWVKDALIRIGKLQGFKLLSALGMDNPWNYRNKAQLHVGYAEGRLKLGYFLPKSHLLAPFTGCRLLPREFEKLVPVLEKIFREHRVLPFSPQNPTGLRHVILRKSLATGEVMVILVALADHLPAGLPEKILDLPSVTSVALNINQKGKGNLGNLTKVLCGHERMLEKIGDLEYLFSATSFFQINTVQTEVLYQKTLEFASLSDQSTVIDLYCGAGTISLFLARQARRVIGVEELDEAVQDARQNAVINNLNNAEFITGRSEEILPQLVHRGVKPDVIVLDPPRKGCHPHVSEAVAQANPQRIIYVSCDPATLARDLARLQQLGYQTHEVQPVDMFPHTVHVECIIMMTNSDSKGK